nr:TlpA disulfide reductase family protein [uncultured Arsenicibacter sp.]
MKRICRGIALFIIFLPVTIYAQSVEALIRAVREKQASLSGVVYRLERTDTLVTGHIRQLNGRATIRPDRNDHRFGFWFRAGQDDIAGEVMYDGHVGYVTDDSKKTYALVTDTTAIANLLFQFGGRMVVPDLIRLDTTKAIRLQLTQDETYYYLTMHYADIRQYDVTNRYKRVQIARATLLPVSVRQHQTTLGKVQDLFYKISAIRPDTTLADSLFREPSFLQTYRQELPVVSPKKPAGRLVGQPAPHFRLATLQGDSLSSTAFAGKVTLLDFWEVWCGPCLASMPKVEQLYRKYNQQGLQVYGITHEVQQLDAVRRLLAKWQLPFLTLIGSNQVRQRYGLDVIPFYVLIDRKGVIRLVSQGFSDDIERTVQQLVSQ